MGRPPAVVIVARHGARLDAADQQWHLTSPTPYDPPLTYGGWIQCRALGARIASLLHAREVISDANSSIESAPALADAVSSTPTVKVLEGSDAVKGKRKKHKIVIHTSPFLRCVQTSVAIAAGISQWRGLNEDGELQKRERKSSAGPTSAPRSVPPQANAEFTKSPALQPIPDEDDLPAALALKVGAKTNSSHLPKCRLRIDAFLGEWLTPDYYEDITPPPSSVMMVAGAKADLLRRGERIDASEDPDFVAANPPTPSGNFPGGWGGGQGTATPPAEDVLAADLSRMAASPQQRRDRASTQGSWNASQASRSRESSVSSLSRVQPLTQHGYNPPIPRHAIMPTDHIPTGHVGHARDACVEVDYQWDSMRPPQNWGDGGEYGEEWSSMHRRFRKGLQSMIGWYALHRESARQTMGHARTLHPQSYEEEDEDTDVVLVLVTHGAGCNALIGALTNQPVLMNVGMASLTMAVRKEEKQQAPQQQTQQQNGDTATSTARHHTAYDYSHPLSNDYSVSLTASTEHLRNPTAALSPVITRSGSIVGQQPQSQPVSAHGSPRILARRPRVDTAPSLSMLDAPLHSHSLSDTSQLQQHRKVLGGIDGKLAGGGPKRAIGGNLHRSNSAAVSSASTASSRSNSGLWTRPETGSLRRSSGASQRSWSVNQPPASVPTAVAAPAAAPDTPTPAAEFGEDLVSTPTVTDRDYRRDSQVIGDDDSGDDAVAPLGLWGGGPSASKSARQSSGSSGSRGPAAGTWMSAGKGVERKGSGDSAREPGSRGGKDEIRERMPGPKRRWTMDSERLDQHS